MGALSIAAVAVLAGAAPLPVAVGLAAVFHPMLFLAGAGLWAVVHVRRRLRRRPRPAVEAAFLRAMAGEVRSGASLRHALRAAAAVEPDLALDSAARLATAGAPFERIAGAVASALPHNGRLAGATLRLSSRVGGETASLLDRLAGLADESVAVAAERRVATAQARLSAGVVVGAPMLFTAVVFASGGADLFTGPGLVLACIGVSLQIVGLGVVAFMLWRSR